MKAAARVSVSNRQSALCIRRSDIVAAARHALAVEGVTAATLGIALLDDAAMSRLHRDFMADDSPTDVLTFPMSEPGEPLAGEIAIGVETAIRQAASHRTTPRDEVLLYVIHGVLHLCGYDDRTAAAARRMRRRQAELLRQLPRSELRSHAR